MNLPAALQYLLSAVRKSLQASKRVRDMVARAVDFYCAMRAMVGA